MKGILIRIKPGHVMDGEGEFLGTDSEGENHTFWRSSGEMEVPLDLALKLEREKPQRFEMVNKDLLKKVKLPEPSEETSEEEPEEPEPAQIEEDITIKQLEDMTKDQLNDWAAKRDYEANPSKQKKEVMITELIKQIEARTGKKVEQG